MTPVLYRASSESLSRKEAIDSTVGTGLPEVVPTIFRDIDPEHPTLIMIDSGVWDSTYDSETLLTVVDPDHRAIVRRDSVMVYGGHIATLCFPCVGNEQRVPGARLSPSAPTILKVTPAETHHKPPTADSMSLPELDESHAALREAIGTLSRVKELALEDECEEPSTLAISNAGAVLKAMFAISPQLYDIYPMGGGEIAIDGAGLGWRVGVFCYSDNSVQYVGWLEGDRRQVHSIGVENIPVNFLYRVLHKIGF